MTALATAFVEIRPDTRGFDKKLSSNVGVSADKAGSEAGKRMSSRFGNALKLGGAIAGALAIRKVSTIIAESTSGYRDHLKVAALTAQVIKTTGGAAKVSASDVGKLSDAIERKTGVDGDAVQVGANMLLTFTNVRNEVGKGNKIFDSATKTVTDMSVALGQDTKGSAIQLGKALNDPIKGVTALSKVGVSFTAEQKKSIKTMVESGNVLGAQKVILKELHREFGGAAAAAASPADKAKASYHQLQDEIGSVTLPVVNKLYTLFTKRVAPVLLDMAHKYLPGVRRALVGWLDGAIKGDPSNAFTKIKRAITSVNWAGIGAKIRSVFTSVKGAVKGVDWNAAGAALKSFGGALNMKGAGKGIDWGKLRKDLGQLGTAIKNIDVEKLKKSFGQGLNDTVSVFSVVIGYAAKHVDTLAKAMPLLIAAFIAYKGAQALANAAAIANVPIRIAAIAGNFALASSQRALATQMAITNGAERVGLITRIRSTVATIASSVAQKAAAAASKVMAAGQWLVNAAMTANPIGLVVVAIAALIGGFVLAYKKSTVFRNIVNGALGKVKSVARSVADWFGKTFIPFFTVKIPNAFRAVLAWVKGKWGALTGMLKTPVNAAKAAINTAIAKVRSIFVTVKNFMLGGFKREWAGLRLVFSKPISLARDAIGTVIGKIKAVFIKVKDWATGTFKRAWGGLKKIFTDPITAARDAFSNLLGAGGPIRGAFNRGVGAIKTKIGELRGAARRPIEYIVNTAYMKGIRPVFQHIPGLGKLLPEMHYARGGVVPGLYSPGRDTHHFTSPTGGALHLSGGEAVMRPEWTRAVGGPRAVARMNRDARAGKLEGNSQALKGGGLVSFKGGTFTSTFANTLRHVNAGFRVIQGGFRPTTSYSGTSHNKDAVDVGPVSGGLVRAMRAAGIAAWDRTGMGNWGPHIHGVPLPGRGFGSPSATAQAQSYLHGGNGLGGRDNGAGSAGGNAYNGAGGGSVMPPPYGGPSVKDVKSGLSPGKWIKHLAGMKPWGPLLGGAVRKMAGSATSFALGKVRKLISAAGRALSGGAGVASGNVQQIVRQAANTRGWGQGDEWSALSNIIQSESGWNPNAKNPISSARGLFQKMTSIHGPLESTIQGQARWGLNYISSRYGDPIHAWNYHKRAGWYDQGGVARGTGVMMKNTIRPERVLSPDQTQSFDRLVSALETSNSGSAGPQRITLDVGGGVTLTGVIDRRVKGYAGQAATTGRQRR